MSKSENNSTNEGIGSLIWNESVYIMLETLKTGEFGSNPGPHRCLKGLSSPDPLNKITAKGVGSDILGPMYHRLVEPI